MNTHLIRTFLESERAFFVACFSWFISDALQQTAMGPKHWSMNAYLRNDFFCITFPHECMNCVYTRSTQCNFSNLRTTLTVMSKWLAGIKDGTNMFLCWPLCSWVFVAGFLVYRSRRVQLDDYIHLSELSTGSWEAGEGLWVVSGYYRGVLGVTYKHSTITLHWCRL